MRMYCIHTQPTLFCTLWDCGPYCVNHLLHVQLHRELDNFDPSFFEEIEDLKYNYHEAQQTIARYEEQLQQLCRQFGVPLPDV